MSVLPSTPRLQTAFEDNNDDLLHLLTDAWDNPLKATIMDSKWTRDYLTKLTSLSLDELLHEPAELREEQFKAKRDAQQLAFRNYPSFLHAQTCRHQAEETLDGLGVHLGEFLASVPELQEACEEFGQHAKMLNEERGKITSVLEHQNVLTDLLEIPQLMETCVWNGYYSEAMDLASHVRLLQVRYPLSVIKSIQQQVQASSDLMLVQLISHLRKSIRLAAAMNVVGFLRRMDAFESETELRMVFLRCRHDFLQQRLVRVKRDMSEDVRQRSVDAFEYLKRFIDVMREQMFEIGTQYISIFSNEQGTLLSDYMVHITGLIKTALDTHLPMIEDTSALTSLLTQLQYCGMSLGRIGLDFRHVFVHSFEEAVQPMILRWIDASTEDLVKLIVKATEEASAPSTWMSSKIVSQNTATNDEVRRHAFQPPMLLVGYPSLAIFTNGILSAFNALRLLPAVSLYLPIQNHLEACFLEIGNALKQYSDQAASHISDEITYLQSFTVAYVRCCVPYLKSCLVDGIYGDLPMPSAADEDMELLLVAYLPVVKKELVEEEKEEKIDDSELPKKEGSETIKNTVLEEENKEVNITVDEIAAQKPLESNVDAAEPATITEEEDSQEQSETANVDADVTNTAQEEVKESVGIEESKEEEVPQEKHEEKKSVNKTLIKPNEDSNDTQEPDLKDTVDEDANKADAKRKEPVIEEHADQQPVKEEAVDDSPAVEEPRNEKVIADDSTVDDISKDELAAENVAVEDDVSQEADQEDPVVEGNPVVESSAVEKTTDTIDKETPTMKEETTDDAIKEEEIEVKKEKAVAEEPKVDNTSKTTNDAELPKEDTLVEEQQQASTTEHTDEEHKEEEDVKTAVPEKKQQQQPKKSKKHKGKKGRR